MEGFCEGAITRGLTPEESVIVETKIFRLLEWQVAMYTGGSSSSVPVETAQELLQNLLMTLGKAIISPQELVNGDLNELVAGGRAVLERQVYDAHQLWQKVCLSAPELGSISLRDTLKSIGGFFSRYDLRYFAHHLPCDIDYQLCLPVPESLLGVDYLTEYLRRLLAENFILRKFEQKAVLRLLERSCRDFRGLLVNLCEPVIADALGLVLIDKQPYELEISGADLTAIAAVFEPLPDSAAEDTLDLAALQLCKLIPTNDFFSAEYIRKVVSSFYPRIDAALRTGGWRGIFV
ncbi:MAG: hypothetical protein EOM14_06055 [Clostridia bacterium]|nr:hypothetical protein [Clostridia bacterium]